MISITSERIFVTDCRIRKHNGRKIVVFDEKIKFLDYPEFDVADLRGDKQEGDYQEVSFTLVNISCERSRGFPDCVFVEVAVVEPIVLEEKPC